MGNARNFAFWIVLFLLILTLFNLFSNGQTSMSSSKVSYTEFVAALEGGQVQSATIDGEELTYQASDGKMFSTVLPSDSDVSDKLLAKNVDIKVEPQRQSGFMSLLTLLLPVLLLIGFWFFMMNRMQGGGKGGAMGFGKSKAKMLTEREGRVTFDDVAGIDEAKEELEEIVEFLRNPQKFSRLGGTIPKGALLVGPPGTGKTLLARAIAGEAGVPFFTISGSDFVEMFVGVGASRVRDMFEQAKKNAPCIVFIDEIDAVGRHRGAGYGGGNDEREQTLNQLLVEMDGFEANEGVIILAATNRRDVLDPALLRPGRFDRQVTVPNPDIKGREKILGVHARKVPLGPDADMRIIARGTPGFSGADLANLVNEAALMAARVGRRFVTMEDFENAKDKVMMGAERRSMVLTDDQKEKTAYHEAGHAVVGLKLPQCDPVYKATIIPRGGALGMVVSLPEIDRLNWHKSECEEKLAMTMAGKAAEIIKYGEENVSNGPAGDIQQASGLARAMVMRWGMSDKVGNIDYAEAAEGYSGNTAGFSVSAHTKELIEDEVKRFIQNGYDTAFRILTEHKEEWERLAQGLLEYETLTGAEIQRVMDGQPPQAGDDEADTPDDGAASVTAIPKTKPRAKPSAGGDAEPEPTA
ncbi:ATP-dependent zinc metalloprotease FtsH [Aliiroseovarius sp. xm-m-379]|uniref:ATP-dependent zinc metalloprotease FtsH n=1 Tax=unclassified Aliiroseovarius TaxID=2623558 RepID=UPI001568A7AA|nr:MULTISPECIES: ATP-dependent zinc metalloprotease FtsH [unclassified Aliiroseovarius]NRP12381.1 ATP-dependent zinc metalloprotease FtsH [Aliiroseovarius sp. xm-d-517]NRP24755.1 ATP-dependent zinc metalloprotease FtsH [Aliiroseovarius sp. xm-m-379]NRP30610.1 ATP-dependent zinc metalloprotease FtsH [Aliiroseovarius sp. xm-m-314]NRP33554.1 ATP-dependent zinc metalloprotease FtsH [Aliiroseovarius sp. xm-a-104]NRP40661.1 ATP-dependent zinc metalloprotease FtsH [Aliiroseovarius sp. xm-m-339-2]